MDLAVVGVGPAASGLADEINLRLQSLGVTARVTPELPLQWPAPQIIVAPEPDRVDGTALARLKDPPPDQTAPALFVIDAAPELIERSLPLLEAADAITTRSRALVWDLLDRGERCVELPADETEGLRLHLALIEAACLRLLRPRPAVSFVIPVYNPPAEFFEAALQSILAQTDPDWELVLLNNGDHQPVAPVLARFSDPRLRYYPGLGRRGIAMGRNLGNLLAAGISIAVMDHDDESAPERVQTIKSLVQETDLIIYSDVVQKFAGGGTELKSLKLWSPEELRRECNIYHPSVAYSWELAARFPYDPRFEPADDYRFYLSALAGNHPARLVHTRTPLLYYRRHEGQHSRQAEARMDAVSLGARADDRYLRESGDPLQSEVRFEPLVAALLAHGREDDARELLDLGHGPDWLRAGLSENRSQPLPDHLPAPALRRLAWIRTGQGDLKKADAILEQGLNEGVLEATDRGDLADLRFRQGRITSALKTLGFEQGEDEPAGFNSILHHLLHHWRRIVGDTPPRPPSLRLGPGRDQVLSLVVADLNQSGADLEATLDSLPAPESTRIEIVVVTHEPEAVAPPKREAGVIVVPAREPSVGARWNQGLETASGESIALLQSGDRWTPGFAEVAGWMLGKQRAVDAVLGRVKAGSETLPDRVIPRSALHRDERALLPGLVIRREVLNGLGGFMAGLDRAAPWEFMIRVLDHTSVLQVPDLAGTSARPPLLARSGPTGEHPLDDFNLALLVKLIHQPLRLMDRRFTAARPEQFEQRLQSLERLCPQSPPPLFDSWEFLAEHATPHHYLYRLAQRLIRLGLGAPARQVLREAMRLKPREPKLWIKYLRSLLP